MESTRQKVTLTLDRETYQAFRALAQRIPGKLNLSALVDTQMAQLVQTVGPLLDQLEAEPDRAKQAAIVRGLFGGMLLSSAGDLDARTRALEVSTEG